MRLCSILESALIGGLLLVGAPSALAEINVEGRTILFYTDDVGIFSATRRLSRDGDPTQPAIDSRLTDKGFDFVFEPLLDISSSVINPYGTTTVDIRGQGFIFADNTPFNHGTLRLQAVHAFSPETRVRFRYYYAPDLLLGDNEERRSGLTRITAEKVTSHIWSARMEREIAPGLEVRLLTRYGLRRYNKDFSQRDTDFWTVGLHRNGRPMKTSRWP